MIPIIKSILTIEAVMRSCGIDLVNRKCCCPFHEDGTPSLSVYANNTKWICFAGCGGGDIFDFIKLFHNTDTTGAVKILADMAGVKPNISRREVEELKKKRAHRDYAIAQYKAWEQGRVNDLSALLRLYRSTVFDSDDIEVLVPLIHAIPEIEYEYEIFCHSDDTQKLELYRSLINAESGRVRGRNIGDATAGDMQT